MLTHKCVNSLSIEQRKWTPSHLCSWFTYLVLFLPYYLVLIIFLVFLSSFPLLFLLDQWIDWLLDCVWSGIEGFQFTEWVKFSKYLKCSFSLNLRYWLTFTASSHNKIRPLVYSWVFHPGIIPIFLERV